MAGIMFPPSSFNIILQKGLAAHVERSSSGTLAVPSGLLGSPSTSVMAGCTPERNTYGMSLDAFAVPQSSGHADAGVLSSSMIQGKRKRGRPRKYGPDVSMALGLASNATATTPKPASPCQKKGLGQPPGFGTMRAGFTPHVITVAAGEDIALKVMSLSQLGPRAVCILSANGAISNVRLQQPTCGGTITYQGCYEILSLSGSFFPTRNVCASGETGGLSVSLAGEDGEIVGGGVAGLLLAASPVQMVIASFLCSVKKSQPKAAKIEKVQKKDANLNVGAAMAEPPTQTPMMAMHTENSPLTKTSTSTDFQQLQSFSNMEGRSFTSLLDVGNGR